MTQRYVYGVYSSYMDAESKAVNLRQKVYPMKAFLL